MRKKHKIEPFDLIHYIKEKGKPQANASCKAPDGYWFLAAKHLSGKQRPPFKFVAAVAAYWYNDRLNVQSLVCGTEDKDHHQVCQVSNFKMCIIAEMM